MRSPEEYFVTAKDGTSLYYERFGVSPSQGPTLVVLDGVLWDGTIWKYLFEYFSSTHHFVHPHYRGHGRSGTPTNIERATIIDVAEDLNTVLEHAGVENACIIGQSMGVQVALEYWHLHPERINALVLVNGTSGRVLDTFHDVGIIKLLFPSVRRALHASPRAKAIWKWVPADLALRVAMLTGEINSRVIRRRDMIPYLRNVRYVDFNLFLNLVQSLDRHDSWSYLADIDVPTLVIAAEKDTFTPPRQAERMASQIPAAEFQMMRGATHAAPLENPDLINLRIEKFLIERVGHPKP
jgi:pimeloyl-ACP methyl ester carboxylesterase